MAIVLIFEEKRTTTTTQQMYSRKLNRIIHLHASVLFYCFKPNIVLHRTFCSFRIFRMGISFEIRSIILQHELFHVMYHIYGKLIGINRNIHIQCITNE